MQKTINYIPESDLKSIVKITKSVCIGLFLSWHCIADCIRNYSRKKHPNY